MKTVDESIDEKGQKLFKIRDDLSKLSEQSRILQSKINQLSTTQVENMRDFLLLCEHLDTHPIQNSSMKGNINPNKVAGDVPLAPSAQNISKMKKKSDKTKLLVHPQRKLKELYLGNQKESGETYGVLGTTSLFPRISIFPNGLPALPLNCLSSDI
ncbi:hypothetical protein H5410_050668 [Solanum commersonii]|uniref:Uncharacterized protein n=1 Tax=Solanum commersonii TaxID=4109 RepID=A0A9J5WW37_SOLCO|nr:hypothetical protein H5410_050668 [Solanum commersonii]